MKHCKRCLLSARVEGAELDAAGTCRYCREFDPRKIEQDERERRRRIADLENALSECRGRGAYDCLVNFSGGKDSVYLLHKLKHEYGLRILALTTNINISRIAWDNIQRSIARLDIDHLIYTPPWSFYEKMFTYLLRNQEARGAVRTVCYICASLTEGYALRFAVEKRIPLVLAGYAPGQPDPERISFEVPRRAVTEIDWTPPELRSSGLFGEQELSLFWNPQRERIDAAAAPRFLAPFHAWDYNQAEVMRLVVSLGLIRSMKYANPLHSNCPLNWLLMYSDLKNLGYNPYQPEFAQLIRSGRANRLYWRLMWPVCNASIRLKLLSGRNVSRWMTKLKLCDHDLVIRRPKQPAWPNWND